MIYSVTYINHELKRLADSLGINGGTATHFSENLEEIKRVADDNNIPHSEIMVDRNNEGNNISIYEYNIKHRLDDFIKNINRVMDYFGVEIFFDNQGGYYFLQHDDQTFHAQECGLQEYCLRKT